MTHFPLALRALLLAAALALRAAPAPAQDTRVENEYKLTVPIDRTEAVWAYLQTRYANAQGLLGGFGGQFSATFADELFFDQYFDTPGLTLLSMEGGIRHRRRFVVEGDRRKDGRELVQIKLRRPGDIQVNRTEVKFDVRSGRDPRLDGRGVLNLLQRDERENFIHEAAELGIEATSLKPTLLLEQRRRRVYITHDGSPFATITLDEVSTGRWWSSIKFTEIELELNEIAYTEADAEQRAYMQRANDAIKRDLCAAFPGITQDQTPKYNKSFNALSEQFLWFPTAMRVNMPLEIPVALASLGVAALGLRFSAPGIRRLTGRRRAPTPALAPHPPG